MSEIQARLNSLTPDQRQLLRKELQEKKGLGGSGPQLLQEGTVKR